MMSFQVLNNMFSSLNTAVVLCTQLRATCTLCSKVNSSSGQEEKLEWIGKGGYRCNPELLDLIFT